MKAVTYIRTCIIFLFLALGAGCGDRPLLTEMGTSRLMVVLKGTYESNSPMPWSMPVPGTDDYSDYLVDDSVDDCDMEGPNPSLLMLDIAEMKLMDSKGKNHRFSNYRQTLSFFFSDTDPFFNGLGVVLENDDVPARKYPYLAVGLYVRKMLIDSAIRYEPSKGGWESLYVWDSFDSSELPSFNFNKYQVHSYYDTLRLESAYLNRVYPLVIPIADFTTGDLGLFFNKKPPLTVLEIRMVVKNYVKKYEYDSYPYQNHYFALSDWLQNVEADETNIGGNVVTIARTYIPGMTGSIRGSNGGDGRHIIAIPAGVDIDQYTLDPDPYGGSATGDVRTNNPCNLPKAPPQYFGPSISEALDYYLKTEMRRSEWNDVVPVECPDFSTYQQNWDTFSREVNGGFRLPPLAVYAEAGGNFTISNVPPGRYDIYRANVDPVYGRLYEDGEFTPYLSNPVTVSIGSVTDVSF
ncbi:MAG: hypothetical protein JW838_01650 [Spirochaetes bacterium]|nr:hypothetical protein [Spirochaetota bacterium]